MFKSILVVLVVFIYLIVGIPILGIMGLLRKANPHKIDLAQLRMVQWIFKVCQAITGSKVTVIGKEKIPTGEPVLYIGNHRSWFDIIIEYQQCPDLTGFVAKKSISKVPLLSWWMKRLHCFFIDRDNMKQTMKMMIDCVKAVKEGISISIFPEGTRGTTESELEMNTFKEGSFKIAEKTGCKIVPVAITGTRDILEAHSPFIKKSNVILEYGDPIDIKTLSPEDQKFLGAYTQEIIRKMLEKNLGQAN